MTQPKIALWLFFHDFIFSYFSFTYILTISLTFFIIKTSKLYKYINPIIGKNWWMFTAFESIININSNSIAVTKRKITLVFSLFPYFGLDFRRSQQRRHQAGNDIAVCRVGFEDMLFHFLNTLVYTNQSLQKQNPPLREKLVYQMTHFQSFFNFFLFSLFFSLPADCFLRFSLYETTMKG